MAVAWRGLEFRMELAGDEPGMIVELDHFDEAAVLRTPGDGEAGPLQRLEIIVVEFVAMAVTLDDAVLAIRLMGLGAHHQLTGLRTEAHRAAQVRILAAPLDATHNRQPNKEERKHQKQRHNKELGAVRVTHARDMARELDHRDLHAEADAEIGNLVAARVFHRADLALAAALAEA